MEALGVKKLPMTSDEIREMIKKRDEKKSKQLINARELIKQSLGDG